MKSEERNIELLLVEDNEDDYLLTEEHLGDFSTVTWAQSLAEAKSLLTRQVFDVVLIDLGLPDSAGIETYDKFMLSQELMPAVIVLTGNDDEALARQSLVRGAQDYLVKGSHTTREVMKRSIKYAIERHRGESALRLSNIELSALNSRLFSINDQLVEARDNAIEANRLKTEFLANVSHEIRTPLSGIVSTADLLLTESCSEEVTQLHDILYSSAQRLTQVVNDLLDISKLESGRVTSIVSECDIREVLNDVLQTLTPTARRKQLTFSCDVDESVPTILLSDEKRLRQILLNLAHNAVKFTGTGFVKIHAKKADNELQIKVEDSGIGIQESFLTKIFEPFVQGDGSITRKYDGTGLGLAIAKKNANLIGGEIVVQSVAGSGSKFVLKLPIRT